MQGQNQTEETIEAQKQAHDHSEDRAEAQEQPGSQVKDRAAQEQANDEPVAVQFADIQTSSDQYARRREFDWLALGVALLIAGLFAAAGRVSPQPATSLVPVAVLSATGCGLLITALRKLHTSQRPGLLEAGMGGLFLALFQFIAAISYPNVIYTLSQAPDQRTGFLSTWGLIGICSIVFSIIGATLGHLAFAPLRPLPAKQLAVQAAPASEEGVNEKHTPAGDDMEASAIDDSEEVLDDDVADGDLEMEDLEDEATETEQAEIVDTAAGEINKATRRHALVGYLITAVLLGFAPTIAGYVFSAVFDYMLHANLFFSGPYPTLRLLSALLPWQVPLPFIATANDPNAFIFQLWLLWRIPLFLGNPAMFDIQALEPYVFNGAALALLLLTTWQIDADGSNARLKLRWPVLLVLEIALGLLLVLPADLLISRGLRGLLQDQILAIPIRTLYILNPLTFTLNLLFGPLVCGGIGLLLFWQQKSRRQTK
jgi:hypothetical protein